MASPEELVTSLPDTLPDDFGGWDNEGSPSGSPVYSWDHETPHKAIPVYSDEWEAARSLGENPKPLGQSAEHKATMAAVAEMPRVSDSAASAQIPAQVPAPVPAPVIAQPQNDFNGRDNEAREAAHSFVNTPKPPVQSAPVQSAERKVVLSPVADQPRVSGSAPSAPVIVTQQEPANELVAASSSRASHRTEPSLTAIKSSAASGRRGLASVESPEVTEALRREADEAIYQLFSARNVEVESERKAPVNKRTIAVGVGACSALLLLILMIFFFHHGTKSVEQQLVQPVQGATDTQPVPSKPKPSAGEPLTQDKTPATTETQQATDNQLATEEDAANSVKTPTDTQTQMMNDQLAAPARIPRGVNKQVAENEPSATSIGTAGAEGLGGGGANVSIFNGHAQSVVKAAPPKPVNVSSGIATGMLIVKTPPTYPPIAKAARVSGTVQLLATISATGAIKDVRVVNGPAMLRQAAVDAVKTWRYKPFKLNNEPTEVETTVNVVFSLGA
jgi:protein TonB